MFSELRTNSTRGQSILAQKDFCGDAVTIRFLCETDIPEIGQIESTLFGSAWSMDSFRAELANERAENFVICQNKRIIGYSTLWMIVDELHIHKIAVIPAFQNRGIASWVVDFILQRAKEKGIINAYIEVRQSNASAIHLYEKFGFKGYGTRTHYYDAPKEDALLLFKDLMEKNNGMV